MKFFIRSIMLLAGVTLFVGCIAGTRNLQPPHDARVTVETPPNTSVPSSNAPLNDREPVNSALFPSASPTASLVIPITGSDAPSALTTQSLDSLNGNSQLREALVSQKAAPVAPPAPTVPSPATPIAKPAHFFAGTELYVHLPPQMNAQQPLRVLLVLHGMGGRGEPFSQNLIKEAERNNWILLAPTLPYRDWMDAKQLMEDDIQLSQRLLDTLDALPKKLGLKFRQHILIYGFSRGAQLAHRFAYFYPERVESVVTISAGTYTLPTEKKTTGKDTQTIPFPYGVGDLKECVGSPINWQELKRVSFWVAVGERDDQAGDVPRAFDPYVGKTRVERAQTFQQALKSLGIDVHLVIFPNVGHDTTPEMRSRALQFLRNDELADQLDD